MVWAVSEAITFGKFFPGGNLEAVRGGQRNEWQTGWYSRLDAMAEEMAPAKLAQLRENHNDYSSYVVRKFNSEPGVYTLPFEMVLEPVQEWEYPRSHTLKRKNAVLADLFEASDRIWCVREGLKRVIERVEPDTHEFFPLEINQPDGEPYDGTFYTMVIGTWLTAFSFEDTPAEAFHDNRPKVEDFDLRNERKANYSKLAFKRSVIGDAHLWRERRHRGNMICLSDTLKAAIDAAGLVLPKTLKVREV